MRLYANTLKSKPVVVVEHLGKELEFSANVFTRASFQKDYDVFNQINRYWAAMPATNQQAVFQIYQDIILGFDHIMQTDELCQRLTVRIEDLLRLHPLDHLELWLAMDPETSIPKDCDMDFLYNPDNPGNTREKTYARKDYMQLAAFSMFLRCLVPIWGEYISSIREDTGIELKEYRALQLLINTGLLESPAFVKLATYTDALTREKYQNREKTVVGISSEDMCFLILALVCVRRVSLADLRGVESTHVVKAVFKFLMQRVFNPTESDSMVREKKVKDGSAENSEQSKRSIMESYRKRTELSLGEVELIRLAYEDLYTIAERFAPGISREAVDRSVATASALEYERISEAQLAIMAWVFKRHLIPQSIHYVLKEHSYRVLGVLEAVLWHRGYHYLAALVTSNMILGREEMVTSVIDSRGQIPDDLQKKILELYPYVWSTQKRNSAVKTMEPHPVLHAIDLVVDELTSNAWRSTASEDKIVTLFGDMKRKFPIQPTIKAELARLIVDVELSF